MVVARKTPAVPPQPTSRSNSSQPLPRAAKLKSKSIPTTPAPAKTPTPQPQPTTPSSVKKKPQRSRSLFTYFFALCLSAFSLYTITVCPTDFPRTSTVCRSLDTYHAHIVEPYVLPPLQSLLHHTEPHLSPYIEPIKPYVSQTVEFTQEHVIPTVQAATAWTVKQYHLHIAPRLYWFFIQQYWNGIIKPIYFKGPHSFIEQNTRPYRVYYHRFAVPAAKRAVVQAHDFYLRVRPHAIHYFYKLCKQSADVYNQAKPHVNDAYIRVRPHVIVLWNKIKAQLLVLAALVRDARKEYVDPHVRKILDKVGEAGSASSFPPTSVSSTGTRQTSAVKPTHASAEEPTPNAASASSVIAESAHAQSGVLGDIGLEASSAAAAAAATTQTPESAPIVVPEPEAETHTPDATSYSSSSVQEAAVPPPSSVSPVPSTEDAADSAASIVAASLHVPAAAASQLEELAPEGDVDDFLKDIGLDGEDDTSVPFPATDDDGDSNPDADPEMKTPEMKEPTSEERAAITAQKRADITQRHHKWQQELNVVVGGKTRELRDTLGELRSKAVEELKVWGKEKKGVVNEVETEAGRLVKGIEGYLKGVEAKGGPAEGEKEKWEKVLEKVEEKFREKTLDVQKQVHGWFVATREKEAEEVDAAAAAVKTFADRAQSDIGLDYAWLDDVTYHDWQKYHDLMRTSENFTTSAQEIQLETNVLLQKLNQLEAEVNEVVAGFGVLLDGVKRRAETEGGVFAPRRRPSAAADPEAAEEPEVSILPIGDVPEWEKMGVPVMTPDQDPFVGRSKEEVEAKLRDVPVESGRGAGGEEL